MMTNSAWSKAIATPAQEFPLTPLSVISGSIPLQLSGTLYRNGPARLELGGKKVGHWFDGDGAILAVHFAEGQATATYRYVQTAGYQKETTAGKYLYANYGMKASGGFWNNWVRGTKNAANTSVFPLRDRLLALWEGGKPHALDLHNLETQGIENLSDTLSSNFSAHPKIDPETKEIYNFGVAIGKEIKLNLYRCDQTGKIIRQNAITLTECPLIHDFVLTQKYLVFFISPVKVNLLPVIVGLKSYSEAMQWCPELGTKILICDRENLSVVSQEISDPWYQWHFTNGCETQDGEIAIEFVRYDDFKTNQYLKEVASGKTETLAEGKLWEIRIDSQTGKVISNNSLSDLQCEFPVVAQHQVARPWRYSYFSTHRSGVDSTREFFNAIACRDRETGNVTLADMGNNVYPSEPIYVPQADNPEAGWIVTVIYDGNKDRSEVRIYQSDRLNEEPVCRLALPSVIPHSFHGSWRQG